MRGLPFLLSLPFALAHCAAPDATSAPQTTSAPPPTASVTQAPSGSASAPSRPPSSGTPFERALDAYYERHTVSEVTLSPDGTKLAWVDGSLDPATWTKRAVIRVLDRADPAAKPRVITAGGRHERGLAWSADGKRLAFLSDAGGLESPQLFVTGLGPTETPRHLTDEKGSLAAPRFSPDGKTIVFLYTEKAPKLPDGAVEPVGSDPAVQRVLLVDAGTGKGRLLSKPGLHVFEYRWSPTGDRLAAIAGPPPGADSWFTAEIYVIDAASGAERSILKPGMQIAEPRWSPDGKSIAFLGGLMSDEGADGGDVYLIPADAAAGVAPKNLTSGFHGTPTSLEWPEKGGTLVAEAAVDGGSAILALRPTGGAEVRWSGADEAASGLSVSADGAVTAMARQSFTRATELWAGEIGKWIQVTHDNEALHPTWGEARSVRWKSDAFDVQGWLLAPPEAGRKPLSPLVVYVHGGPANVTKPRFSDFDMLAAAGYFVFFPNPRGSFGMGEAFTQANVKDFGGGDLRDILSGLDEVLRTAPVDKDRIGLFGWSYGGFMAMWAPTQTTRFRAVVAGAGIANWQSYAGQNAIGGWQLPYFGASIYDDPRPYLRANPIDGIKHAKAPTLLMVGEKDTDCPAPQSYEYWRALKAQHTETELVVYPGEPHGFQKPAHLRDRLLRIRRWFDAHL